MHPGFWTWWQRQAQAAQSCGDWEHDGRAGWGSHRACRSRPSSHGGHWHAQGFDDASAGFGVRRPLRFLAHKLDLDDDQVSKLAAILSALKTERAQSDVDQRRRTSALAEAFEATSFDSAKVDAASLEQTRSAERLHASIKAALAEMHDLLDEEQRKKFAYLLRAGALSI
jgi:Spy/CpxP family protein refolding chaperone